MKNKTYIWNRIAQKTLEIAYIAALCVFMVLFSMLLIVICIVSGSILLWNGKTASQKA